MQTSYYFDAVLWDMDGTLVDSEPFWLQSEKELMAEYDYIWTDEDQRHCLGGPLLRVGKYMYELAGHRQSPEFFMHELTQRTAKAFFSSIKAMPGVAERLEELHQAKIPMALVTASPRVMADNVSAALGAHYFQSIVSTDDVVNSKPDPEGYLKAARQLNVDIEKCLIFEDSNTGVRAAQASGASVVGLTHLTTYEPHPRTIAIASIESISHRSLNDFYIAKKNRAEE